MAHWFHRNPYKATAQQKFDVSKISIKSDFLKVIYDVRDARIELLKVLQLTTTTPEQIEEVSTKYMSLIQGLFEVPSESQPKEANTTSDDQNNSSESKNDDANVPAGQKQMLNSFFKFRWTQSLHVDKPPLDDSNAKFDMVNMIVNVGLWYSKHAAKLAAQSEISMEDAKLIHTCLRKAAGVFKSIKTNMLSLLTQERPKTSDLDDLVLDAYIFSSQAEAQEVTIARAVEKKHTAKLIAGLANETSKLFQQADDSLKIRDQNIVGKWRKYLQLKEAFYRSFALCYYGVSLLEQEKCGDSVRVFQESSDSLNATHKLCSEYKQAKGAGSTIKPNEHAFYLNFTKDMTRRFEKAKHENGFIYHQKVPPVSPSMSFQATHGLVEPIDFEIPAKSSMWNSQAYAGFSISKNVQDKKHKSPEKDAPVKPVKEPDIKVTKDACVIS